MLLSCGGLPPVPPKGGTRWVRVEGEHFTLYSDEDPSDAVKTLVEMEHTLQALSQVGWQVRHKLRLHLEVVVFDNAHHLEPFTETDIVGYYVSDALLAPMVVMRAPGRLEGMWTLNHELTHYIAFQMLPHQPAWFAEGVASYFESARFARDGRFVIGEVPKARVDELWLADLHPASRLMTPMPGRGLGFYATAWMLVHYLMSERGEAFAAYQHRLQRGETHEEAWRKTLPDLTPTRIDELLRAYRDGGVFRTYSQEVTLEEVRPRVKRLTAADVHALRAQLYATCQRCDDSKQRARAEIREALKLEPSHLRARALTIARDLESPGMARMNARELAHLHPQQWLAWLSLAIAQRRPTNGEPTGNEITDAAERAFVLNPNHPYALMYSALSRAENGDQEPALQRMRQAEHIQPQSPRLRAIELLVFLALGRCEDIADLEAELTNMHAVEEDLEREAGDVHAVCLQRRAARAATADPPVSDSARPSESLQP